MVFAFVFDYLDRFSILLTLYWSSLNQLCDYYSAREPIETDRGLPLILYRVGVYLLNSSFGQPT